MALHTRVIVRGWKPGDVFVRETIDRGAKFRDAEEIERVANEIKEAMRKHGLTEFRIDTRETD